MLSMSSSFEMFPRRRTNPSWVPCAGAKRKARVAGIDEFDPGCGPAPAKQFATDQVIGLPGLKDGFYMQQNDVPLKDTNGENLVQMDEEMEEEFVKPVEEAYYARGIDNLSKPSCGDCSVEDLDGRERRDLKACSLRESQPNSASNSSDTGLNSVSLVLSDEIQETLARRRLNEDLILPKLIMDKVKKANSMALVVWKPPVTPSPLDLQNVKDVQSPSIEGQETTPSTDFEDSLESDPLDLYPASANLTLNPAAVTSLNMEEEDFVDMDTTS